MEEKEAAPDHDHLFEERWYPLDRFTVRRKCCYPGCIHVEIKDVRGVA